MLINRIVFYCRATNKFKCPCLKVIYISNSRQRGYLEYERDQDWLLNSEDNLLHHSKLRELGAKLKSISSSCRLWPLLFLWLSCRRWSWVSILPSLLCQPCRFFFTVLKSSPISWLSSISSMAMSVVLASSVDSSALSSLLSFDSLRI